MVRIVVKGPRRGSSAELNLKRYQNEDSRDHIDRGFRVASALSVGLIMLSRAGAYSVELQECYSTGTWKLYRVFE